MVVVGDRPVAGDNNTKKVAVGTEEEEVVVEG